MADLIVNAAAEVELLERAAAVLDQPLPADVRALVDEAVRLYALGKTLNDR